MLNLAYCAEVPMTSVIASIHSLLERPLPHLGSSRCSAVLSEDSTDSERALSATGRCASGAAVPLRLHSLIGCHV